MPDMLDARAGAVVDDVGPRAIGREPVDPERGHATTGWRDRPWARMLAGALLAGLLASVAVVVVTQLWNKDLHVPFQYSLTPKDDQQDATLEMMVTKDVQETGWYNTNPQLNAPFSQHWAEWPEGGDVVAYTVKKGLLAATDSVPVTDNLFWLLTFPLTAIAAYPVLRLLRCSFGSALVASVLFALAPYHFRNGMGHENLAFYVSVPFVVLFSAQVLDTRAPVRADALAVRLRARFGRTPGADGHEVDLDTRDPIVWPLLAAALIGITGLYYLGFFLSIVLICALLAVLAYRRLAPLIAAVILGAVALLAAGIANLPTFVYRATHSANVLSVGTRPADASEAFPVRLVELLSPIYHHRLAPLSALNSLLAEPGKRALETANLGVLASIGFVVVLLVLPRQILTRGDERGSSFNLEARIGIVVVVALLLGMKGGISRLLAQTSFGEIRAWVRITIVIAFACLVVFARLLDRFRAYLFRRYDRDMRTVFASVLVIVCVVGILDQTSPGNLPDPGRGAATWRSDDTFVHGLEARLPHNAMVFQMPVADFPEGGGIERMPDYAAIQEGYIHSKDLRWSAGGVRGRSGEWQYLLGQVPTSTQMNALAAAGFSALTIDRFGFSDNGRAIVAALEPLLGAPMLESPNGRLVAFDLRPVAQRLATTLTPTALAALRDRTLNRPRVFLTSTYNSEVTRGLDHLLCRSATIELQTPTKKRWSGELALSVKSALTSPPPVRVMTGSRTWTVPADGQSYTIPVSVRPGITQVHVTGLVAGVPCGGGNGPWYELHDVQFRLPGDAARSVRLAAPAAA
jgi:phosphoglycerol transferase